MADIKKVTKSLDNIYNRLGGWMTVSELDTITEAKELLKAEQPKKGHWFIDEYEYLDCSVCGEAYFTGCESTAEAKRRLERGEYYNYCPYCGAYMRKE